MGDWNSLTYSYNRHATNPETGYCHGWRDIGTNVLYMKHKLWAQFIQHSSENVAASQVLHLCDFIKHEWQIIVMRKDFTSNVAWLAVPGDNKERRLLAHRLNTGTQACSLAGRCSPLETRPEIIFYGFNMQDIHVLWFLSAPFPTTKSTLTHCLWL